MVFILGEVENWVYQCLISHESFVSEIYYIPNSYLMLGIGLCFKYHGISGVIKENKIKTLFTVMGMSVF